MSIEPLLVFPDPPPPLLAQTLDLAGHPWKAVANASITTPADQPTVEQGRGRVRRRRPRRHVRHLPRAAQARPPLEPVLLLVAGAQLTELELREDLFDDSASLPSTRRSSRRACGTSSAAGSRIRPEIVEYGDLVLNLETYQATLRPAARPHLHGVRAAEILHHSPGQGVHPEQLLSRVWGYEYYGGARTVDVHVRRLRAKLGEERASLIQTVRSVGYRFGSPLGARGRRRPRCNASVAGCRRRRPARRRPPRGGSP